MEPWESALSEFCEDVRLLITTIMSELGKARIYVAATRIAMVWRKMILERKIEIRVLSNQVRSVQLRNKRWRGFMEWTLHDDYFSDIQLSIFMIRLRNTNLLSQYIALYGEGANFRRDYICLLKLKYPGRFTYKDRWWVCLL